MPKATSPTDEKKKVLAPKKILPPLADEMLQVLVTIENLTGGTGTDRFAFHSPGNISGTVNGGAGSNILDYSTAPTFTGPITVNLAAGSATAIGGFSNIQQLVGSGSASDTLIAADVTNTWSISSADGGKIFSASGTFLFSSVENLMGGAGTDA